MRKTVICVFSCMLMILAALQFPGSVAHTEPTLEDYGYSQNNKGFLDVTFQAGAYKIDVHPSGFSEVSMAGYGNNLEPGKPMLPTKTFYVGLPPGCIVESITLLQKITMKVPGVYHIQNAPLISHASDIENKDGQISSLYDTNPPMVYEHLGMSRLRKYSLAMIRISPMTYHQISSTLLVHKSITLRIYYTSVEELSDILLSDNAMDDAAARTIYNYDTIMKYYQTTASPRQTHDYVIITTSSLTTTLTGFLNWKTILGYNVNIVTLTWILANYPAADTQKSIRDFLIANYASWGIKYVLIVSTHASIPMRICYPDPANHNNDGVHDIPTDYYYADLTGNWDSDGDGFYGERGQDNVDFTPEVIVGRIPTDGASAVLSIMNKIQSFEQTAYTGWKKNALLLGAIYNYANENHSGNPRLDGADVMEQCKNNLLSGFSVTTMYEKQGYGQCPYSCTHPLNNANVKTQWGGTAGWGIVNWAAHGSATAASRKVWNTDDGDGVPEYNGEIIWPVMIQSSDNGALNNNNPPIVFAASCLVSRPESSNNLGISLLVSGASAFVGATRVSYASQIWTQPAHGGHGTICYDFTDRITNKNEDCGHALYNAKRYVYTTYPWNLWQDHANMYNFNLYGDPSMGMNLAPGKPAQPTGPTTGITGISYTYSTVASDPTGDKVKYGWDWNGDGTVDQWDDNSGSYYTSGQQVSIAHAFSSPGTYPVQVKAEDSYGKPGGFSQQLTVVISQNQPPTKPAKPSGPTSGNTGTSYTYTTSATDPESYPVAYGWDWNGDGTVDQWVTNNGSYYPSGQTISTSHTWTSKGKYSIKVKAKDIHGNEGVWSDPLPVTMPLSKEIPLLNLLHRLRQLFPGYLPLLRYIIKD